MLDYLYPVYDTIKLSSKRIIHNILLAYFQFILNNISIIY